MKTVQVVVYHDYEDYEDSTPQIETVFSTEELATAYIKRYGFSGFSIHEFTVDELKVINENNSNL